MTYQPSLFDQPLIVHVKQRGEENQKVYQENFERLTKHGRLVFDLLMKGEKLSVLDQQRIGTMDIRARIYGLKRAGVQITSEPFTKGMRCHFMTEEQVNENKKFLTK